ncbi:hypothetical protein KG088_00805 [Halomonas sp. TRM85114]|nr:hypothetical protein [Halomonas jincaotanensis]
MADAEVNHAANNSIPKDRWRLMLFIKDSCEDEIRVLSPVVVHLFFYQLAAKRFRQPAMWQPTVHSSHKMPVYQSD